MKKINILLLSLTVLSLMNVNFYKNNDNKQLEETTNDTNLVEARKLNDSTSNEEVKISNILKVQYTDEEDGTKSLRFVAGISTLSLNAYFVREEIKTDDNKINMPKKEIQVTSAYIGIQNGNKVSKPSEIFGEEYDYVVAYTLKNIPEEYWFTEINVSLVVNNEISTYRKANVTGAINNYSGILVFSDDHQAVGLDSAVKDTIETVNIPAYYYNITNDEHNLIANENDKTQVLEVGRVIDETNIFTFFESKVKKITIPRGINKIGRSCFYGCKSLTYVSIPESVIEIEEYAFCICTNLTVYIPRSVKFIGKDSFDNVKNVFCEISEKNDNWNNFWCTCNGSLIFDVIKNGLFNDFIYAVKDTDIESAIICGYIGTNSNIIIPSEIDNLKVTTIGRKIFSIDINNINILIPNTVATIEREAFSYSNLKSIVIPKSVVNMGASIFSSSTIKQIFCCSETKPNGWNNYWSGGIGEQTNIFYGYETSGVYDGFEYVISLDNNEKCVSITNYIGDETNVTIPSKIEEVNVTKICKYAFSECDKIIDISMPNTIKTIENNAFEYCSSLEKVTIPNSTIFIGDYAFFYCIKLKNIVIPKSVEYIGEFPFGECKSLKNIYCCGDNSNNWHEYWNSDLFIDKPKIQTYYNYKNNNNYKNFDYIVQSVDGIDNVVITNYNGVEKDINIPDNIDGIIVTEIGNRAFEYCVEIENVYIPNSVLILGDQIFLNCTNLQNVIIPKSVIKVGSYIFSEANMTINIMIENEIIPETWHKYWCYFQIYNIDVYNGVNLILGYKSKGVFENYNYCIQLINNKKSVILTNYNGNEENIVIPNEINNIPVASLGTSLFNGCDFIKSITIPNGISLISAKTFYKCTSLKNIILPNTITNICSYAFGSCSSLEEIIIPKTVKTIYNHIFYKCTNLKVVYCEAESKSSEWDDDWNGSNAGVIWGFIGTGEYNNFTYSIQIVDGKKQAILTGYNGDEKEITLINNVDNIPVTDVYFSSNNLESIIIPKSFENIGKNAFIHCKTLKLILCETENKPTNWYDGSDKDLGYENQWNGSPATIVWGYKNKLNYGDFSCIVQSINNEENIFVISYNGNEKDITIPNEINGLVVKNVSLLQNKTIEKIILPDTIEEICDYAFANCSSLKEITLSNKINVIGSFAFGGCKSIEYINLSNCKKIGSCAFAFCTSLKSIIIPESVSEIGFGIFYDCTSLETINFVAESLPTEAYFINYRCNAKIVLGYKEQ